MYKHPSKYNHPKKFGVRRIALGELQQQAIDDVVRI